MSNLSQFASQYGGTIATVIMVVVVFVAAWRLLSSPEASSGRTYHPYDRGDTSRRSTVNGRAPD